MYQNLLAAVQDGVNIITINRPDKMNALNQTVIEELHQALQAAVAREDVFAILLTGAGPKAFVAGADISEFKDLDAGGGASMAAKGQQLVFNYIEQCPKPVVAAVNGFALGGGCELAMACHFRVAADTARFGQPEVNLGLIPGYGGTQRLTQLVGKGKAMEWMMTGAMIPAAEALQWGLVNYVTTGDALIPKCMELLQLIGSKAPLAITHIIKLTNMAASGDPGGFQQEIASFGDLFDTADKKEGVAAFLEKRKALFTGK